MLHQLNPGKPFQVTLTVLILGMTSACESETNMQAAFRDAETRVLKSEQRAVAAEVRMNEISRKLQEAEKAKAVAIEARKVAEQQRDEAKSTLTFHKAINVIFIGLIVAAFFAGLRQGGRRRNDNDVIGKATSDDPYIERRGQVVNAANWTSRSARS